MGMDRPNENRDAFRYAWTGEKFEEVQDEAGVDLELLRENLKLTPTERYQQYRAMGLQLEVLRRARGVG